MENKLDLMYFDGGDSGNWPAVQKHAEGFVRFNPHELYMMFGNRADEDSDDSDDYEPEPVAYVAGMGSMD